MKNVPKWCVSIVLFVLAAYVLDWASLKRSVTLLTAELLIYGLGLCSLTYLLLALRWILLVQPVAMRSWKEHLRIYLYANLLNALTPANLGGDAYRVIALKSSDNTMSLVVTLIQERILGLLGYLSVYIMAFLMIPSQSTGQSMRQMFELFALGASSVLFVVILLSFFSRQLQTHIMSFDNRFPRCVLLFQSFTRIDFKVAYTAFALSTIATCIWAVTISVVATRMDIVIPLPAIGVAAVIVELIRIVPTTVQGIGVREAAMAFFLGQFGATHEEGFVIGTVCYLLNSMAMLLTGAIGAIMQVAKDK